jgi:hypothetical protein
MHKPSRISIYGVLGLTAFGVGYDCGLFGPPDGFDHSAVISVPASTTTASMSFGVVYVTQAVTGDDIVISLQAPTKRMTQA